MCWMCVMTPRRGHLCAISKRLLAINVKIFGHPLHPWSHKVFWSCATFPCQHRLVVLPCRTFAALTAALPLSSLSGTGVEKNLTRTLEVRDQMVKWLKDNKSWISIYTCKSGLATSSLLHWLITPGGACGGENLFRDLKSMLWKEGNKTKGSLITLKCSREVCSRQDSH